MRNYLEFEKEIKSLEDEVDNLKSPFGSEGISKVLRVYQLDRGYEKFERKLKKIGVKIRRIR